MPVTVTDSMGQIVIDISSVRQRILEAFQPRSEIASAMTDEMREDLVARLIHEYGDGPQAVEAVWALARETDMYREAKQAEQALLREKPLQAAAAEQGIDLFVAWHKVPIGRLHHNGYEWRWTSEKVELPSPVRDTVPGKLPPFISALLPEGWLEQVLNERDERGLLLSGKRYMSNISIVNDLSKLGSIPEDVKAGKLIDFTKGGVFTGTYKGPKKDSIDEGFERGIANMYANSDTPRLSGVQIKAPMYLHSDGSLLSATGRPFTHIMKPSGAAGFEALPLVEWLTLTLASRVGFVVPDIALIQMPEKLPPALIVERFDIREDIDDKNFYCLEDFCSLSGVSSEAKYHSTIERVARDLSPVSSDPQDTATLLKRAFFAWLVADGDMHLKNLALLKTAEASHDSFTSVHFAPTYDAVCTRVFPTLVNDRMALKLNGKDDRLKMTDFMTAARTMTLQAGESESALRKLAEDLKSELDRVVIPQFDQPLSEEIVQAFNGVIDISRNRINNIL
ncbi:HipA domain-containing protein [Methylobacterium sp. Leaf125]|uniref:type II toxin-antitoxin system HipA family toxin n=1 Tax=Methylobacterium sp. Leaf125 TaxID=1736265 RepID=UPI00138F88E8|nr:HipA domain-containing protein [Methylobacterium sp. Leaf125]